MRSLAEVVRETGLDPARGLDTASVARSRQRFGGNTLTPLVREPVWRKFLAKFDDPIIRILLAAAMLSMLVDLFRVSAVLGAICFGVLVAAILLLSLLRPSEIIPIVLFLGPRDCSGRGRRGGRGAS